MTTNDSLAAELRRLEHDKQEWKGHARLNEQRLDEARAELERLQNKLNTDSQNFELEARKEQLRLAEAELETLKKYGPMTAEGRVSIELHALKEMEAELERVKAERDAARRNAEEDRRRGSEQLDKALSALREIDLYSGKYVGGAIVHAGVVARRCLAVIEGEQVV